MPSGPMFTLTMSSTKPVRPSTATCQRPGTSSRFMPIAMKPKITRERDQHPQRAVGEADVVIADVQRNQRLHRELVHRVDLACGRHACSSTSTHCPELGPGVFEIRMTFLTPTPKPKNSISTNIKPGPGPEPGCPDPSRSSRRRAERRSDGRRAAGQIRSLGIGLRSSVRFASACCKRSSRSSSDSSRASGGSFGTSSVSSSAMRLPCASPPLKSKGQAGTRNMAESDHRQGAAPL